MKYVIDTTISESKGFNLSELLACLLMKTGVNIKEVYDSLVDRKVLVYNGVEGDYLIESGWDDVINDIILDADKTVPKKQDVEGLAKKLRDIFPEGKKDGTNKYWRGNTKEIVDRLRKFYKLYGNKYSDETIIEATKNYVESFNGNYSYMRLLKYFIWKCDKKIDSEGKGYVDEVSDLADYIENKGQIKNDDWMLTIK